jgi:probable HAF family extracellular repeat protein
MYRSTGEHMKTFLAIVLSLLAASAVAQTRYRVIDLGTLGDPFTQAWAINNRGSVAGSSGDFSGFGPAFVYTNGKLRALSFPDSISTEAFAINDKEQIAGRFTIETDVPFHVHPLLYSRRTGFVDLGTLGADDAGAFDINNKGQVTGYARVLGQEPTSSYRPFIWDKQNGLVELPTIGGNTSPQAISNDGHIVGHFFHRPPFTDDHAFIHKDGVMTDLGTLGGRFSFAYDINDRGEIVGGAEDESLVMQVYVYANGTMRGLGTLVANQSAAATAINNRGQIVGDAGVGDTTHAFIYENGHMHDLNDLIDPSSGFVLHSAKDINDRGQIAAVSCDFGVSCRALRLDPVFRHK